MKKMILQAGALLLCSVLLLSGCKKTPASDDGDNDSAVSSAVWTESEPVSDESADPADELVSEHGLDDRKSAFGQTESLGSSPINPEYEKQRTKESYEMQLTDERILWHGRTKVTADSAYMDWSGSGFEIAVMGGTVSAQIFGVDNGAAGVCWIAVYVDGVRTQKIKVKSGTNWYTLAKDLPQDHLSDVRVVKLSEAICGVLTVSAIKATGNVGTCTPRSRRILWIGDSITAGYGVWTAPEDPFTTETQDITATYGWLLSEQYHAEAQFVCASGYGLATSNSGSKTEGLMPPVFPKTSFARKNSGIYPADAFVPDLIVINLGTNDVAGGGSADDMCLAAYNFLYDLHAMYPKATLLWTYGNMLENHSAALQAQVRQFGEKYGQTHYVQGYCCQANERGSSGHPNAEGQKKIAATLAEKINGILGW